MLFLYTPDLVSLLLPTASLLGAVGCIPIATSGPLSLHHLTMLGASASRKWRYFVKEFLLAIVIVYPLEK